MQRPCKDSRKWVLMEGRRTVGRLQRGDVGGLEFLVGQYQVRAMRTAYLITHDSSLAQDIVQAAFVKAYERIGQFDPNRPFGPWFLRSVLHDAIKAATKRQRLLPPEEGGCGGQGADAPAPPDNGPRPRARRGRGATRAE